MKKSIKYLLSLMFIVVVFLPMNAKAAAGLCAFGATDPTTCCSSTTSSGQCTDTPPLKWNVKVNVPDDSCQQDSYVTGKLTAATLANKQYNCGTDTSPCRTGHADCSGTCLVIQTDDGDVAPGDGYVDGLTCAAAHRSFSSCTGKCGTCLSSYADVSGACTLVNPMEVLQVGSSWYGVESDLSNYSSYLTRLIGGGSSQWTTSGNDIYNSNTGNVGIGTTTPTAKLDIAVPSTYTGAVFKAGYNINPLTTPGNYSVAMGVGTRAAGNRSTAMGYMSYASGLNSTAMGYMSYASGLNSTAMGDTTSAGGTDSTAMGWNTKANWSYATAMGNTTTASGDTSTAMGWNTIASALASTAMGQLTVASGNMSTAMGWSTTAQPFASVVIGQYNVISGTTNSWVATDPLFVIGNGTSTASPSNAMTVLKNGNVGIGTTTPQNKLHVVGNISVPWGFGLYHYDASFNVSNISRPMLQEDWTNPSTGGVGDYLYFGSTGNRSNTLQSAMLMTQSKGISFGKGTDAGSGLSSTFATIDNTGNVGIGTGTSALSEKLQVNGNVVVEGGAKSRIYMGGNPGDDFGIAYSPDYSDYGIFYQEGSPDYVAISPNGAGVGGGALTPVLYVDGDGTVAVEGNFGVSGAVGIGRIPYYKLDVAGSIRASSNIYGGNIYGAYLSSSGNLSVGGASYFNGTVFHTDNSSSGSMYYFTNNNTGTNADIMSLQVGIGQATGSNCWIKFQDANSNGQTGSPINRGTICGDNNGGIAIGADRVTISTIYTPFIYDSDNTGFYLNPSSSSSLSTLYVDNNIYLDDTLQIRKDSSTPGTYFNIETNSNGDLTFTSNGAGVDAWIDNAGNGNVKLAMADFKFGRDGYAYAGSGFSTPSADYAEWFKAEEETKAGDIIGVDRENGLVRRYQAGDIFIGIYSEKPSVIGNHIENRDELSRDKYALVGLLGQLKFNKEQTVIKDGVVTTPDGVYIGVLLADDKVLLK